MSFSLYFLGAEQASWARTLADEGVNRVGLSFWSLCRRVKPHKVSLARRFDEGQSVLLESGGFQANSDPNRMTVGEWQEYAASYEEFVERNIDRLSLVTELDCPALGPAWVSERRREFYEKLPDNLFLPVWHPDEGQGSLADLIERYGRVSVVASVITERGSTVAAQLMQMHSRHKDMKLHGSALTKTETVERLPFTSAASSSWLSPTRFGDTIVWDGVRMVRYPVRYRDQARERHRRLFAEHGFDADAIAAGENKEVTRLTIWSWLRWEEYVNQRHGTPAVAEVVELQPSNSVDEAPSGPIVVSPVTAVRAPAKTREVELLPIVQFSKSDDPEKEGTQTVQIGISSRSQRVCDSCFLATDCDKYQAGYACGYDLPVEVRTKTQRRSLLNAISEMQWQRIAFMRLKEERSGGYADPNLSSEIKLLVDTMKAQAEIEDDGEFIEMTLRGRGPIAEGPLSRIFGAQTGQSAQTLPRALGQEEVDRVIEATVLPAR